MSNSTLVNYTKISPHREPRNHKIDKITIHHMAGNLSVETCGNVFQGKRKASSNYGVGSDGRVGMYVEETDRAMTSSNAANDNRAVTIEVANDGGAPDWHVSDKALEKTIELCVDICRRNDIPRLNFTGDKSGNLTMHKYFTATACPGPYLGGKFPYIAEEVNKRLAALEAPETPEATEATEDLYRVRKTWEDAKTQVGAYKILDNAKKKADANEGCKVFDESGKCVYDPAPPKVEAPAKKTIEEIAKEVIAGKWGNGSARKDAIVKAGYDYDAVQSKVNEILEPKTPAKKSVDEIAREVIAGKWGNGATRKAKLIRAGYDYNAVQRRVNALLR